ncbi:MAG: hypothetical protein RKH07_12605 [Gammaproteobacteria bacterium]
MSIDRKAMEDHLRRKGMIDEKQEQSGQVAHKPLGQPGELIDPDKASMGRGRVKYDPGKLNKTEQRYIDEVLWPRHLAGEIAWFSPECIKRRVGPLGSKCWYKPDFEVIPATGFIEYHEIKGGWIEDDARVKFLAAARAYPMFRWVMWQYKGAEWRLILDCNGTGTRHQVVGI